MALVDDNERKLKNRLGQIIRDKENFLIDRMSDVLQKAADHALELHEVSDRYHKHTEVGQTYGWMIVKNGSILKKWMNKGSTNDGNIDTLLDSIVSSLPSVGWIGVVMAEMNSYSNAHEAKKNKARYYVVRFESDVLLDTAQFTSSEFDSYFTQWKIAR